MTTHTTFRTIPAVALASAAIGLAACGGDEPTATGSSAASERREAALAFARCMREHGIDFPDPKPGGGPTMFKNDGDVTPEQMREAQEACEKHRKGIEPPELSEAEQQEFKDAALAHARCMRKHGVDMPDPTFGANGEAQLRLERGRVDSDDPDFRAAQEACEDELPMMRSDR